MARRHYAGRRGRHVEAKERHASANDGSGVRTRAGKEKHVGDAVLISRCIFAKNKHRAMRTVPDDPYAGPEIDGPRNPVTALWNEDDSLAPGFLELVDGGLNGQAVVCRAVALNVEVPGREINGGGVVEAGGIYRVPKGVYRAGKRRNQRPVRPCSPEAFL